MLPLISFVLAARRLLESLSIEQGLMYDAPQSVSDIPLFAQLHSLNVGEILDLIAETFNEFVYRKLKPDA